MFLTAFYFTRFFAGTASIFFLRELSRKKFLNLKLSTEFKIEHWCKRSLEIMTKTWIIILHDIFYRYQPNSHAPAVSIATSIAIYKTA